MPTETAQITEADALCRSGAAGEQWYRCAVLRIWLKSRRTGAQPPTPSFYWAASLPLALKTSRRVIYGRSLWGRKAEPHRRVSLRTGSPCEELCITPTIKITNAIPHIQRHVGRPQRPGAAYRDFSQKVNQAHLEQKNGGKPC
ncbi:hypothetical protein SKAU_G00084470 [Synaphobranchus kaupii]|uniref:Uncharacterized protein n=1 Tax=Synaphobranchus kaupii TaxID=118154 RepID=A0A9Q1J5I4_SYNKA|nr:hypothetical protein SKAU_G00084470 [Synaphobranchus kaupii]